MRRSLLSACLLLVALPQVGSAQTPRDEYLYLNTRFDTDGFAPRGSNGQGDFDGAGAAYLEDALPRGRTWVHRSDRYGTITFLMPPSGQGKRNLLALRGQTIPVSTTVEHNVLFSLGAAHFGDASGFIELIYKDGSTARAPIAFTDWAHRPHLGEEIAITTTASNAPASGGDPRYLFLQRTPIPPKGVLRAIRLPTLPNAKILALTLATRIDFAIPSLPSDAGGVATSESSAPVAILRDPSLPTLFAPASLEPEDIAEAFSRVGIETAFVSTSEIAAEGFLTADRWKLLVLPHGGAFPEKAAPQLEAFRAQGGAIVHSGPPWAQPLVESSYGDWLPPWTAHDGRPRYIGLFEHTPATAGLSTPRAVRVGAGRGVTAGSLVDTWNLASLPWDRYRIATSASRPETFGLDPKTLGDGAEVILSSAGGEALAFFRDDGSDRGPELSLLSAPIGIAGGAPDRALATALIVRGSAWLLHREGAIDARAWQSVRESPLQGVPAELPTPPSTDASPLEPFEPGPLPNDTLHVLDAATLSPGERILAASLQGLLHREARAALLIRDGGETRIDPARQGFGATRDVSLADALELLDHRRAVVVDPEVLGSINLATMVGASEGILVAMPGLLRRYGLEIAADLRGLFASHEDMIEWADEVLRPRLSSAAIAIIPPRLESSAHLVRDLAIARRLFTVWQPTLDEASTRASPSRSERYLRRLFQSLPPLTPVIVARDSSSPTEPSPAERLAVQYGLRPVHLAEVSSASLISIAHRRSGEASGETGDVGDGDGGDAASGEETSGEAVSPGDAIISVEPKLYIVRIGEVARGANLLSAVFAPQDAAGTTSPAPVLESGLGALLPALEDSLGADPARGLAVRASDLEMLCAAYGYPFAETSRVNEIVRTRGRQLAEEIERSGALTLSVLDAPPDRLPRVAALLAEIPGERILALHSTGGSGDLFPDASRIGETTVLRVATAQELATLGDPATLESVRPMLPIFVAASDAAITASGLVPSGPQATAQGAAPPGLVHVLSPAEALPLARAALGQEHLRSEGLVEAGSTWRYHDRGEDLGTRWRQPAFDDSRWKEGRAKFGYGDGNEATVIEFGGDAQAKHLTYYFRKSFKLERPAEMRMLALEFVVDDGLVVYLNGEEIHRRNLPEGDISYSTLAPSAVAGSAESAWNRALIAVEGKLRETNVIAVEVHQQSAGSTDLGFDLRLRAYGRSVSAKTGGEETSNGASD